MWTHKELFLTKIENFETQKSGIKRFVGLTWKLFPRAFPFLFGGTSEPIKNKIELGSFVVHVSVSFSGMTEKIAFRLLHYQQQ